MTALRTQAEQIAKIRAEMGEDKAMHEQGLRELNTASCRIASRVLALETKMEENAHRIAELNLRLSMLTNTLNQVDTTMKPSV